MKKDKSAEKSVERITGRRRGSETSVLVIGSALVKRGIRTKKWKDIYRERKVGWGTSNETLENIVKTSKRKQYPRVGSSECPLTICTGLAHSLLPFLFPTLIPFYLLCPTASSTWILLNAPYYSWCDFLL